MGAPSEGTGNAYLVNTKTNTIRTLADPHPQMEGIFGYRVAISGAYIIVGAPNETVSGFIGAGDAYVFSSSTGAYIRTLTSPTPQSGGFFGFSEAIYGSTLIVGAALETASSFAQAGHVYAFSAKTGSLLKTLTSPNAQTQGAFGYSLAVSGSTIVVGVAGESVSALAQASRVYTYYAKTDALLKKW